MGLRVTTNWSARANGNWTDAANWDNGVPNSSTDAVLGPIVGLGGYVVTLNGTIASADNLTISVGGGTLDLASQASLSVAGDLTNAVDLNVDDNSGSTGGSTVSVGGTLANSGSLFIGESNITSATVVSASALANTGYIQVWGNTSGASATLDIAGAAGFGSAGVLTGVVELLGTGLIDFAGGGGITSIANGARLTLDTGAGFIETGGTAGNSALTGLTNNAGTLELAYGNTISTGVDFTNTGTVNIDDNNGSTGGSTFTVAGTLSNSNGLYIGESNLTSATVVSASAVTNTGYIQVWGNPSGASATLDIAGAAGFGSAGVLTGAVELLGTGSINFAGGGGITSIASGARLTLDTGAGFIETGGTAGNSALTGLTNNAGTLELAYGNTISTAVDFTNTGTVNIDDNNGSTGGSTFTVAGTISNSGNFYIGESNLTSATVVSASAVANTGYIQVWGNPSGASATLAIAGAAGFGSAGILTGAVELLGTGSINFAGGGGLTSIASGARLTLDTGVGFVEIGGTAGNSALTGLASNAGELDLAFGNIISTGANFTNTGTTNIDANNGSTGGSTFAVAGTIGNSGNFYIGESNLTSATVVSASAVTNTGYIQVWGNPSGASAAFDIAGAAGFGSAGILTGAVELLGTGSINFAGGGGITSIASGARLTLDTGVGFVEIGGTAGNSALTGLASNAGELDLAFGNIISTGANFTNTGTTNIDANNGSTGGSTFAVAGTIGNSGNFYIGESNLTSATVVSASAVANTGYIQVWGNPGGASATLDIAGAAGFGSAGILTGAVELLGTGSINFAGGGGITSIASGARLTLDTGAGFVEIGGTAGNSALTGLASNAGELDLAFGSTISTGANFTNTGTTNIDANNGSTGGSTFTVAGTIGNSGNFYIGESNLTSATVVSASAVANTGYIQVWGNPGGASAALDITGAAGFGSAGILTGAVELLGTGSINFAGGGGLTSIASGARLTLDTGAGFVEIGGTAGNSALTGLASNAGELDLAFGNAVSTGAGFTNTGTTNIDSNSGSIGGSTFTVGATLSNTGNLFLGEDGITAASVVSAAALTNTNYIQVIGDLAGRAQALLDVTGTFSDSGRLFIGTNAIVSAAALLVQSGGSATVTSGGLATGLAVAGGSAVVSSGGTVSAPVISGGTLELATGTAVTGAVTFSGGGTLQIDNNTMPVGPISSVVPGDTIDLRGLTWAASNTVTFNGSTLTVSGGGVTDTLTLSGVAPGTQFVAQNDGLSGTMVTTQAASATAWNNTNGGDWTSAPNWTSGVPGSVTDATIAIAGGYTVSLTNNTASAATLTISDPNATLLLSGAAMLTVQSDFTDDGTVAVNTAVGDGGATLTVGGTLTDSGDITIGNATLIAPATVSAGTFVDAGSLSLVGNGISGTTTQATLAVTSAGPTVVSTSVIVQGDADLELPGAITSIVGGGVLELLGAQARISLGAATSSTALTTLSSNAGTLELRGDEGEAAGGAALAIAGDFANSGTLKVDTEIFDGPGDGGSTLTIGGTLTNSGNLDIGVASLIAPTTVSAIAFVESGSLSLIGNGTSGTTNQATLAVTGAGPTVVSTSVIVQGDADLELPGAITSIVGGGFLELLGAQARVSLGAATSSTALTTLSSNAGTLELRGDEGEAAGGAALAIAGNFANSGTLKVDTEIFDGPGDGGSTLTIGGTLTNSGNLDIGVASLIAPTTVSAIAFVESGSLTLIGNGTSGTTNQATLAVTGAGPTVVSTSVIVQGDADLELPGAITSIVGGGFLELLGAQARVSLGAATSSTALTTLSSNAGTLELRGDEGEAAGGAALAIAGDFANNGTLKVDTEIFDGPGDGGSTLTIGGTLTNSGNLDIGVASLIAPTTVSAIAFVESGSLTLIGNGTSGTTNQATLAVTGAGPTVVSTSVIVQGDADLELPGMITSIVGGGFLELLGSQARVSLGAATSSTALTALSSNSGTLELRGGEGEAAGGAALAIAGDFANSGTLKVDTEIFDGPGDGGSTLTIGGTLTNSGSVDIGVASLVAPTTVSAAALVNQGALMLVGNTTSGTSNRATFDIGGPAIDTGSIVLAGDAVLSAGSLLVQSGGTLAIGSGASAAGVVVAGGSAAVSSGGTISAPVISGGTLELATGGGASGSIVFGGSAGILRIDDNTTPASPISGVVAGDVFDLRGLVYAGSNTASFNGSTLTVSGSGGVIDTLSLANVPFGLSFVATGDGASGTDVTAVNSATEWTNPSGGSWFVGTNWSNNVPTSSLDATIGVTGSYTVTLSGAVASAKSLTIDDFNAILAVVTSGGSSTTLGVVGDLTNSGTFAVDSGGNASGTTVTVGGTFTNVENFDLGDGGPSQMTVGALVNTGNLNLIGDFFNRNQVSLVAGNAAPATFVGNADLNFDTLIQFASGGITTIAGNSGILLNGPMARIADAGATGSNSALTGLSAISGALTLEGQAGGVSLTTSTGLTIVAGGGLIVDPLSGSGNGGSTLAIGGALSDGGSVTIGNSGQGLSTSVTAASLSLANTGVLTLQGGTGSGAQAVLGIAGAVGDAGILNVTDAVLSAASIIVQSGGLLAVGAAASATAATVASGGREIITSGGIAAGVTISGGTFELASGGIVSGNIAFASSAGTFQIDGSTMPGNTILGFASGGVIDLRAVSGAASGTIAPGNVLDVVAGGSHYDLQLDPVANYTGYIVQLAGDGASGTDVTLLFQPSVISAGQSYTISSGQSRSGISVLSGGTLIVLSGGSATATSDAGTEILSGGTETSGGIGSTGVLSVGAGGRAVSVAVVNAGDLIVLSGGSAVADTSTNGGRLDVSAGAVASGSVVSQGGFLYVEGGTASASTIGSGGDETVSSGGVASGSFIASGGSLIVQSGGSVDGLTLNGGSAVIASGGSLSGAVLAGGTLDLAAGASLSSAIAFSPGAGLLEFDGVSVPAATIVGFAPGDMIDLRGIGYVSGSAPVLRGSQLTVMGTGDTSATLTLSGLAAHRQVIAANDGSGGTLIEAMSVPANVFTGVYPNGLVLNNPTMQNPATIAASAYVTNQTTSHGGDAVYGTNAAAWSVSNFGTINGTGQAGAQGIHLQAGGIVINSGDIIGARVGVEIVGAAGSVSNIGTIASTSLTARAGIYLTNGSVTNQSGGVITSYRSAIATGGPSTIVNFGIVSHVGPGSVGNAIYLGAGGVVTNYGTVSGGGNGSPAINGTGGYTGAIDAHGFATLTNLGAITNTNNSDGVNLLAGGLVVNGMVGNTSATIYAHHTAIYTGGTSGIPTPGALGTVINYGTIRSTDGLSSGIRLAAGGTVTNRGLIDSGRTGISISGTAGTIVNFGIVSHSGTGSSGNAVYLGAGGSVTNYGQISGAANGSPSSNGTGGYTGVVEAKVQRATVINLGTIINPNNSDGVNLLAGGLVVNGTVGNTSATIYAHHTAIYTGGTSGVPTPGALGTVTNYGTIRNTDGLSSAIVLESGGTVTNRGLIASARTGVNISGTSGTVVNYGTVQSTSPTSATAGSAVYLQIGGQLLNEAVITALRTGISVGNTTATAATVSIANAGIVQGANGIRIGAFDTGNATIVNLGVITGTSGVGIGFGPGNGTVFNAGTIIGGGGTAVAFGAGSNLLVVDPGAVFSGAVVGGSGANALELASGGVAGVLNGLGSTYTGFQLVTVDPGAVWRLSGTTTLASGATLSDSGLLSVAGGFVDNGIADIALGGNLILNSGASGTGGIAFVAAGGRLEIDGTAMPTLPISGFGSGDVIDLLNVGYVSGAAPVLRGSQLTVLGTGGTSATLTLSGVAAHTQVTEANDGSGGTLLEAMSVPGNVFTGVYANGLVLNNPAVQNPATIAASAVVTYSGAGYARAVYGTSVASWTVVNDGTVSGNSGGDVTGIGLALGGTVVNGGPGLTGALIAGGQNGISMGVAGGAGTVINYGTIASTGNNGGLGVQLAHGGLLVNGPDGDTAAVISSGRLAAYIGGNRGTQYAGATGTVINYGTMLGGQAAVIDLASGGTVANYGTIASTAAGVTGINLAAGGTVFNRGVVTGDGAVYAYAAASITNAGRLVGTGASSAAVSLAAGGGLTNVATGVVSGYRVGVFAGTAGGAADVVNTGLILASATAGAASSFGVLLNAAGTVSNSGTIAAALPASSNGGGEGVVLNQGGTATNGPGGVVSGSAAGIAVTSGAAMVNNLGLVAGGVGVSFGAGNAAAVTLVNYGTVIGSGGIAVQFGTGLDALALGAGSLLTGAVAGLRIGDLIDLRGLSAGAGASVDLGAGNLLSVSGGGQSATLQLDPGQNFAGDSFDASSDNAGGTVLRLDNSGVIGPGQTLTVQAGQTLTGISVLSGGTLDVVSGGTVIGATIGAGATEIVAFGGTDISGTISSGGFDDVFGVASATLIVTGGTMTLEASGLTIGTLLDDSALQTVSGVASGTVVSASDRQVVASGGVASGTVVSAGGSEVVQAGGTTVATSIAGGLVDLQAGASASGGIGFTSAGGTLEIDGTVAPATAISGLNRAAAIDLRGIAPAAANTLSFNPGADTVTVSSGGTGETLQLSGVPAGTVFGLLPDGFGGTVLREVPPIPGGLGLTAASDSGVGGDGITNVTTPTVSGTGEAGDTLTLLDGALPVGSGTVAANGSWAVTTAPLANGTHTITAFETDALGNASALSAALGLTIDTAAPVTTPATLAVLPGAAATPIGIAAPSEPGLLANQLSVRVTGLPGDGTVTLADGATPVSVNEALSVAQLTGLAFTPAAGAVNASGTFAYTVSDPAGNSSGGQAVLAVTAPNAASLYGFVFTYGDGKDYYFGTVADDGSFGYTVGKSFASGLGQYTIVSNNGVTSAPAGTVSVASYSHAGTGEASTLPVKSAAGQADGTAGLGSEVDAVAGTDGLNHAFSSTVEASFPSIPLYGFVYTYANGLAFYTGTVADSGTFGTTPGTRTVTDTAGHVLGTYSVFADGVTTRASGSVVVDRLTVDDAGFVPIPAGAAPNGGAGLGSESGTISVNGAASTFSSGNEPNFTVAIAPVTVTPPPSAATVFAAEVTELYQEVLNRAPDAGGLANSINALANGLSLATIRQDLAQSSEAQADLNQLYNQTFDRNGDSGGLATYTAALVGGASLASVQLILAQSPEAQSNLQAIYQNVLNRAADPGGLVTYMGALATGNDLDAVRGLIAHSQEAQNDLSALFQTALGRGPSAAELVGMEDQLGSGTGNGANQAALTQALTQSGSAGGYTSVTPPTGNAGLTAVPGTPTLFAFGDIAFGQDTIAGFDTNRDTIQLSTSLVADFATLQRDTSSTAAGTLITLNPTQSITLANLTPSALTKANFLFS